MRPYTTSPTVFLRFSELFLFDGTRLVLKHPKVNEKSEVITWIDGYNGRTAVEVLHLKRLYVDREALPPLNENEFYLEDLSGLAVFNQDDKYVGIVNAALDYGAGTFLDIKLSNTGRIATLPFNKHSIIDVDLEARKIKIDDAFLLK